MRGLPSNEVVWPARAGGKGRTGEATAPGPREKARGVEEARRIASYYAESEVQYVLQKYKVK